jgi:flagellar motor protein MotB
MKAIYPRWAISFADLLMLLLAFFVMLQSSSRANLAAAAHAAFGGRAETGPLLEAPADRLFEQGEARLTASGQARVDAAARSARGKSLLVGSEGHEGSGRRFDAWELAAAPRCRRRAQGVASGRQRQGGGDYAALRRAAKAADAHDQSGRSEKLARRLLGKRELAGAITK